MIFQKDRSQGGTFKETQQSSRVYPCVYVYKFFSPEDFKEMLTNFCVMRILLASFLFLIPYSSRAISFDVLLRSNRPDLSESLFNTNVQNTNPTHGIFLFIQFVRRITMLASI